MPKISVFPGTSPPAGGGGGGLPEDVRSSVSSPEAVEALRQAEAFERVVQEQRAERFRQDGENQAFERVTRPGSDAAGPRPGYPPNDTGPSSPGGEVFGLDEKETRRLLATMSPQAQSLAINRLAETKRGEVLGRTRATMGGRMSDLLSSGFFEDEEAEQVQVLRDLTAGAETFADLQELERAYRPVFERTRARRIAADQALVVDEAYQKATGDARDRLGLLSEAVRVDHKIKSSSALMKLIAEATTPSSGMNWEKFYLDAVEDPLFDRTEAEGRYDAGVAEFGWPARDGAPAPTGGSVTSPTSRLPQTASFVDVEGMEKAVKSMQGTEVTLPAIRKALGDADVDFTEANIRMLMQATSGR